MDHPFSISEEQLEEQLQAELDAPGDIALAAGMTEVTVCIVWQPELIHRAEESSVKGVSSVGFEADVLVFPEICIFVN